MSQIMDSKRAKDIAALEKVIRYKRARGQDASTWITRRDALLQGTSVRKIDSVLLSSNATQSTTQPYNSQRSTTGSAAYRSPVAPRQHATQSTTQPETQYSSQGVSPRKPPSQSYKVFTTPKKQTRTSPSQSSISPLSKAANSKTIAGANKPKRIPSSVSECDSLLRTEDNKLIAYDKVMAKYQRMRDQSQEYIKTLKRRRVSLSKEEALKRKRLNSQTSQNVSSQPSSQTSQQSGGGFTVSQILREEVDVDDTDDSPRAKKNNTTQHNIAQHKATAAKKKTSSQSVANPKFKLKMEATLKADDCSSDEDSQAETIIHSGTPAALGSQMCPIEL